MINIFLRYNLKAEFVYVQIRLES